MIDPTAARSGLIRDTSAPITAPMISASAKPMTARLQCGPDGLPEQAWCSLLPQVGEDGAGPGRM